MRVLLLLLLPSLALAVPAGRSGQLDSTATPSGLAVSEDERFIAMVHAGDTGLTVFDRTSFLDGGTSVSVCSDAQDVTFASGSSITDRFYVACGSGQVFYATPDATVYPATWTVSSAIELSVSDDKRADVVAIDFATSDTVVHAVLQGETTYSLWTISLSDDTPLRVATDSLGLATIQSAAIGDGGSPWILADAERQLTAVTRSGFAYSTLGESGAYPAITGLAVSSAYDAVYVADNSDSAIWVVAASSPLYAATQHPGTVSSPVSMSLGGTLLSPFLWVGESGGDLVALESDGGEALRVNLDDQDAAFIAATPNQDGAVYVAGGGGTVRIVSDRPFVTQLDADVTDLAPGESYTLTMTANVDADGDLRVGGDLDPASGTSLATVDLTADTEVSVTLSADDLPEEGENRVYLFVDDGGADVGNDSIALVFDGPPDSISDPAISAADERLDLRWTASDQSDITTYEVALSEAVFDPDSSVPSFTTTDGTAYPLSVTAGEPSSEQSLSVEGLTNGTTYYLALRAVDAGGLTGPWSAVVSGVPKQTCGAAECAGEPSGCSTCTSFAARPPQGRIAAWVLLGLLAWLVRRR